MPELPEVETIKIGLSRLLPGLEIKSVEFDWPKSFPNNPNDIEKYMMDKKIVNVARRAKVLAISLSSNYSLVVHLKMTGQLVFRSSSENFGAGHPSESLISKLPDHSTRVTIIFNSGAQLYFNDQRKFGWMRLLPSEKITDLDFFQKYGPEPLGKDFSWLVFRERLQKRKNARVKAALLDQSVIAGVGNIYADESLWGAKIHPATVVKNLSENQIKLLHDELIFVLKLAITKGGSTDKNYVSAEGKRGSYLSFARVFRREGQHCPRCGQIIKKIWVAGRGTHICPDCQRED